MKRDEGCIKFNCIWQDHNEAGEIVLKYYDDFLLDEWIIGLMDCWVKK